MPWTIVPRLIGDGGQVASLVMVPAAAERSAAGHLIMPENRSYLRVLGQFSTSSGPGCPTSPRPGAAPDCSYRPALEELSGKGRERLTEGTMIVVKPAGE